MNNSFGSNNVIDSFYESLLLFAIEKKDLSLEVYELFKKEGFNNTEIVDDIEILYEVIQFKNPDLLIIDLDLFPDITEAYDLISSVRKDNADIAILTLSKSELDMKKMLELVILRHFIKPENKDILLKAAKSALGYKNSYEVGMQYFDALFGMQMCTHRDLHQRTFDHVIRTTNIYGKFLLYLTNLDVLKLTSWALKNCLMASLVHDIGKLLVMHGVLYKDGKLTDFEYEQVKQHSWNSVTALLGGQDIKFFANEGIPLKTVSGYNDKNLRAQVQNWIFKVLDGDMSVIKDVDLYFNELSKKPFIHSLNKDLLTIVFRHHDGIKKSYHSREQLDLFAKLMNRNVDEELSPDSPLDLVTNALSICDVYDALIDKGRSYRKKHYSKFFALYLLYTDMKRDKFFSFLIEHFIQYVMDYEELDEGTLFQKYGDGAVALNAIKNIYAVFKIEKDQEQFFNDFLIEHSELFEKYAVEDDLVRLRKMYPEWIEYFHNRKWERLQVFLGELKKEKLLYFDISLINDEEMRTFEMLYHFYYSYSSKYKQGKLISYLVSSVIKNEIDDSVRDGIVDLVKNKEIKTKKEFEAVLVDKVYGRKKLLEVFKNYDENLLIGELNDFLRKGS